jgi:pentatricopeptide repeat protein
MKNILTIALLVTSMLSFSQNNNKVTGETFIKLLLQEKKYQEAYSYFDEIVKSKISIKLLEDTALQLRNQLGEFKTIIEVNKENDTFFYYSDFEKMKLDVKITFNENSKIIGFFFAPHKEFKKVNSLGKDLNIRSGNIDLKGTILLPERIILRN